MSTTNSQTLYRQLLRPPILDILRAAGFTRTRPAVLETLLDLTSRYLALLAYHTARHARHHELVNQDSFSILDQPPPTITITDVRMALQDVGALHPQASELEEKFINGKRGEEDVRGVNNFIDWCQGDVNAEIRRVAGLSLNGTEDSAAAAAVGKPAATMAAPASVQQQDFDQTRSVRQQPEITGSKSASGQDAAAAAAAAATVQDSLYPYDATSNLLEDYLSTLKRKHSKIGEESRWQGTVLGKEASARDVVIEGWDGVEGLSEWGDWVRTKNGTEAAATANGHTNGDEDEEMAERRGSESSSPLSELGGDGSGAESVGMAAG